MAAFLGLRFVHPAEVEWQVGEAVIETEAFTQPSLENEAYVVRWTFQLFDVRDDQNMGGVYMAHRLRTGNASFVWNGAPQPIGHDETVGNLNVRSNASKDATRLLTSGSVAGWKVGRFITIGNNVHLVTTQANNMIDVWPSLRADVASGTAISGVFTPTVKYAAQQDRRLGWDRSIVTNARVNLVSA